MQATVEQKRETYEAFEKGRGKLFEKVSEFVDIVHPLFEQHGWTYFDTEGPPTKKRLEVACDILIQKLDPHKVTDNGQQSIGSGRIRVIVKDEPSAFRFNILLEPLKTAHSYKPDSWE
jgi:hypothetical protein